MTFPLIYLLYVFFAFLIVWGLFFLISLFHVIKYGFLSFLTFFSTFIFIAGSILILSTSSRLIQEIDWQQDATILEWLKA